jgi:SAM-dependent methyltransferase
VTGLAGLDIGCGEGYNTRKLAERGARMVALDVASTFVRAARDYEPSNGIRYLLASAPELPFASESFDFVTAFMSLMDVAGLELALAEAARVVKPEGFLQFSILHPCFCPPYRRIVRDPRGAPVAIEVARYFERTDGKIEPPWLFGAAPAEAKAELEPFEIPRFHRTMGDWLNTICAVGLCVERAVEPTVDAETATRFPILADTRIAPYFLLCRCRKLSDFTRSSQPPS